MRYTVDTEFLERGAQIDLISIAVVGEDGREFYAVSSEFNQGRAKLHPFVSREVWPQLPRCPLALAGSAATVDALDTNDPAVKRRSHIAQQLAVFLLEPGTPVELWAWFSAFDHVAWTGLYGSMVDLPAGLPWITRDIEDYRIRLGRPELPAQTSPQHHALNDARHHWVQLRHLEHLDGVQRALGTARATS